MTPSLPDEILSKIAKACVDGPWKLWFKPGSTKHHRSIRRKYTFDGLPDLVNVKLTNRFFYEEIWSAIKATYDGQLDLCPSTLEGISILEQHQASVSWLMPRIIFLRVDHLNHRARYHVDSTESFIVNTLPNLKTLVIRSSGGTPDLTASQCMNGQADALVKQKVRRTRNHFDYSETGKNVLRDRGVRVEVSHRALSNTAGESCEFFFFDILVHDDERLEIVNRRDPIRKLDIHQDHNVLARVISDLSYNQR